MMKRQNYPNLDLLRSLAVLFVLFDHTLTGLGFKVLGFASIEWIGRAGVLFFFVHTCCVLMMSLERDPGTIRFYIRRIFRIYPLSIAAVFCVIPVVSLRFWEWASNMALAQNLTFARDSFGSIWSLPIEVQMYLFLPLIFWISRKSIWIPFVIFATSVPVALWQPHHVARAGVLAFAPCFIPGAIAYGLFRTIKPRFSAWFVGPVILAITSVFLVVPNWRFSAWIACLALGLFVPFFRQGQNAIVNHSAQMIAKYSYGIYLTHSVLLSWINLRWESLPFYLGAVAFLSWACYHTIEHPFIMVGKQLTKPSPIPTESDAEQRMSEAQRT